MRSRPGRAAVVLLTLVGTAARCQGPSPSPRLEALRRTHEQLHERLEDLVAKDPLLAEWPADGGEVGVGLRIALVKAVFQEVARRYLDRVLLDLSREIRVREGGEVKAKTFLGTIKAGDWTVDLVIHRIRGVLRAKSPRVDFSGTNRVRLGLGVVLEGAQGSATLHFAWDASGVASVVCKDFDVTQDLTGIVLPDEYPVAGAFVLSAGSETLLARPEFPDRPFRLRLDLSPESWDRVRSALESQDRLFKCGIALDPDALLPRLKELGRNGFDLRLPRSLFRAVELPASLRQSVTVEQRQVELSVKPNALRLAPQTLWYSAAVRSLVRDTAVASPAAAPHWRRSGRPVAAPP